MIPADGTIADIHHVDHVVAATADVPESFARRHVVLTYRIGTIGYALCRGDIDALRTALRAVDAACLAWINAIERDRGE